MKFRYVLALLLAVLVTLLLGDLVFGSVRIPPGEIFSILAGQPTTHRGWNAIILLFRLPKALTATAAGAGLALSGLMLQTLFRNPLAGPSVLGISSGASLGVALVVMGCGVGRFSSRLLENLSAFGNLGLVLAAIAGAGTVLAIILLTARFVANIMTLLIVGLLGGYALNSIVSVLIHFSRPEIIQAYLAWSFGNFGNVTWQEMRIFLPLCTLFGGGCLVLGKALNGLLLGETYARSMGLDYLRIRLLVITMTAILVGCITAYCGPIAFIGIAVPHLARALATTSDHRRLLPVCALLGAATALAADLLAQLPGQTTVLPLNAVTALIGSPVIIWYILKRQSSQHGLLR
jgi:iron complex transport system permease protein